MLCLFSYPYNPYWTLIYLFPLLKLIVFPLSGPKLLMFEHPILSLLNYAKYAIYLSLLSVLTERTDSTLLHHVPIPIEHLPFQTACFQNRQSAKEKPNFHHLFSVLVHDAVFDTYYFIISAIYITLHLLVLIFFLNKTKHISHRQCHS